MKITNLHIYRKYNINTFAVDPFQMAIQSHFYVLDYSQYAEITHVLPHKLYEKYDQDGFTHIVNHNVFIVYNQRRPITRQRWTILHELCHIFLEHIPLNNKAATFINANQDRDADRLCRDILCPLPIVHALQLETVQEIQELFFISRQAAENRWNEYLSYRNKKDTPILDIRIQKHFAVYVEQTQRRLMQMRYQQRKKSVDDIIQIE